MQKAMKSTTVTARQQEAKQLGQQKHQEISTSAM
jgi:hypothetical protein